MIDVPQLDTIDFEALVEEAKSLIPRYAPDWTDHNLHDPGITFIDLLAWIVDQQIYRIGFVSDAHLAAFAALLGIARKPAKPARGLIWPRAGAISDNWNVAAGTRAHPVEQPDLAFMVSRGAALAAAAVERADASGPFGTRAIEVGDQGEMRLDPESRSITLQLTDPLPAGGDAPRTLGLAFAEPLPGVGDGDPPFRLDYRDGGSVWHRPELDWTGPPGTAAGVALFKIGEGHAGVDLLRLDFEGPYPRRALPIRAALNVLPIVQLERRGEAALAESLGWPDMEVELGLGGAAIPAFGESEAPLAISVGSSGPGESWRPAPDLRASGPFDNHYQLDGARGVAIFGNGVNGRVPPAGHQIVRGLLDVTRGAGGNLPAQANWNVSGIAGGSPFGRNFQPVGGGADAWSRDDLLAAMRLRARRRQAMLSDGELTAAARALDGFGIAEAEALPRYLPASPGRPVPGARTLLLRPRDGVEATDAWLDAIDRVLAPRRVLGERLSVVAAEPASIDVEATLLVAPGSDMPGIGADAEARLRARLSATGSARWPSGRPVMVAELTALLAAVDGVAAVPELRLARPGQPPAAVSLLLRRTEIAIAGEIRLAIRAEG